MPPAPRNLVNLSGVSKDYAGRTILEGISLGVSAGERIGIVGRNGDGKSTLLRLMGGTEEPDTGAVTREGGLTVGFVRQDDALDPAATIRAELVGGRADHEWAGDAIVREVLDGLLGGVAMGRFPDGLDTIIGPLSGGERRRIALAKALIERPELLLLDEPTNHLDPAARAAVASQLGATGGAAAGRIFATHDLTLLHAFPNARLLGLRAGQCRFDLTADAAGLAEHLSALYETPVAEHQTDRGRWYFFSGGP